MKNRICKKDLCKFFKNIHHVCEKIGQVFNRFVFSVPFSQLLCASSCKDLKVEFSRSTPSSKIFSPKAATSSLICCRIFSSSLIFPSLSLVAFLRICCNFSKEASIFREASRTSPIVLKGSGIKIFLLTFTRKILLLP